MKPTIFLDIDGVMTKPSTQGRNPIDGEHDFILEAVEALNELIREMGAVIVITSTWRYYKTIEKLQDILDIRGVEGEIVGATKYRFTGPDGRGQEIREYMEENGMPETFIILDDAVEDIKPHFKNSYYEIDPRICLRKSDIPFILEKLKNEK